MSGDKIVSGVFISYRRSELSARAVAGRLRDRLVIAFEDDHVFLDTEDILAGISFLDRIDERTAEGTLVLVLIGPEWPVDRLQNPDDVVRREITRGLIKGAGSVAVLLDGASMPDPGKLPEGLADLGSKNAFELSSGARFHDDVDDMETRLAEMGLRSRPGFTELFNLGRGRSNRPLIRRTLLPLENDVVDAHELFGGRRRQLKAFDDFLNGPATVLFVQGRSGYGKTALMAQYVRRLRESGLPVVYHFVSRIDKLAGEPETLLSLCQQLCFHHRLRGWLPASAAELWSLYRTLITATPPVGQLVIVIDGLDEADSWRPSEKLIAGAPTGTRFILSARLVAQVDWVKLLTIAPSRLCPVEAAGFSHDDIAEVLSAHSVPDTLVSAFADSVAARSAGDPLYVHFLAMDLAGKGVAPADLATLPAGLDEYFHQWWNEATSAAGNAAVQDLLGYMTTEGGRLTRDELIGIAPGDALSGISFDQGALEPLQRLLTGDDNTGYEFSHPRFRDYAAARMGAAEVDKYRRRLRAWCERCVREGNLSPYVLLSYPRDLAEDSQRDTRSARTLLELTRSGSFLARKFRQLGSYQQIIDDLRLAQLAAEKLNDPLEVLEIGLLISAVAYFVSASPAEEILPVYVALGEPDRAIDLVRLIDDSVLYGPAVRALCGELATQDPERAFRLAEELTEEPEWRSEAFAKAYQSLVISSGPSRQYEEQCIAAFEAASRSWYRIAPCYDIAEALLARAEVGPAKRWLERALDRASDLEDPYQRSVSLARAARISAQFGDIDTLTLWVQALQALATMNLDEWVCIPARDAIAEIATINPEQAIAVPSWFHHAIAQPVVVAETGRVLLQAGRYDEARARIARAMEMADDLDTRKVQDVRWRRYTRVLVARAAAGLDPAWALDYLDRAPPVPFRDHDHDHDRQPRPDELTPVAETWPLDAHLIAKFVARAPTDEVRATFARRLAEAGDQEQAANLAAAIESDSKRSETYASIARASSSRHMFEEAIRIAAHGDVEAHVFVELARLAPGLGVSSEIPELMSSRFSASHLLLRVERLSVARMARIAAESNRSEQARALLALAIVGGIPDDEFAAKAIEALDRQPSTGDQRHRVRKARLQEDDLTRLSSMPLDELRARAQSDPKRALAALSALSAKYVTAPDPARAGTVVAALVQIGAIEQEVLYDLVVRIAESDLMGDPDTIACLRAVARLLPHIALRLSQERLYPGILSWRTLRPTSQCMVVSAAAAQVAKEDIAEATQLIVDAIALLENSNSDEQERVSGLLQIAVDTWPWSPTRASELFNQGLALARSSRDYPGEYVAQAAKVYAVNHSQASQTQALMCEAVDLLAIQGPNRVATLQELSRGLRYTCQRIVREVFYYLVGRAAWLSGGSAERLLRTSIEEVLQIAALLEPDREILKSRLKQSLARSSVTARSLFEHPYPRDKEETTDSINESWR